MRYLINTQLQFSLLVCLLVLIQSCSDPQLEYSIEVEPNPHKIAPLTAYLHVSTQLPAKASAKVLGNIPVENTVDNASTSLKIPVMGLYPGRINKVQLTLDYGENIVVDTVEVPSSYVPDYFPRIEIDKIDRSKMESGMHACDIHFANHGKFRSVPTVFDDQGVVRWYLDLSTYGHMLAPFQRLSDGNLLMVSRHTIHEFDMMGKIVSETEIDNNYGMHHDVVEIPGDRLLICVGKRNMGVLIENKVEVSDSDFIILYDRKNSRILKEWDMAKHLDVSRDNLNFFRKGDWLHMNGLAFDESDGSIIVSGKNQGLAKISWDDELQWIMSPHRDWGRSGRDGKGSETEPFLLYPQDSAGRPYSKEIQYGDRSHEDFDFPWGPHSPEILPNGNLLVFDNGTYRNFEDKRRYSRAVEYSIDQEDKKIVQKWQYGKERGEEFYSSIVSDVDFLPDTQNILVTSGYLSPRDNHSGKIVEVAYDTRKEVFEATLFFKSVNGDGSVAGWGQTDILYRSERMELKY